MALTAKSLLEQRTVTEHEKEKVAVEEKNNVKVAFREGPTEMLLAGGVQTGIGPAFFKVSLTLVGTDDEVKQMKATLHDEAMDRISKAVQDAFNEVGGRSPNWDLLRARLGKNKVTINNVIANAK